MSLERFCNLFRVPLILVFTDWATHCLIKFGIEVLENCPYFLMPVTNILGHYSFRISHVDSALVFGQKLNDTLLIIVQGGQVERCVFIPILYLAYWSGLVAMDIEHPRPESVGPKVLHLFKLSKLERYFEVESFLDFWLFLEGCVD